ncbi:hypothetical protein BHU72_13765 [Desulfuribacillus stibiiarsenatis]|uniref:CoA activase n=1 Tax=Desulfuribacillus stibiiarsenatis TaxID=1390249 RepID=A0A1E5L8A5_9FIRM|nr:acyl-CoA dehydratase activase [Desulfuribacillus stibiiarsenatis]OEH86288.1 hypothetical protein BHU72_13765 [Desulfuribacillus stibiiarsenatis]
MPSSLGIDIGSSSVKVAIVDKHNKTQYTKYVLHFGKPLDILKAILNEMPDSLQKEVQSVGFTGNGSKQFKDLDIPYFSELSSQSVWAKHVYPDVKTIIEMGGQETKRIRFTDRGMQVDMSSDCSAGTGSFLEHQAERLGLPLDCYRDALAKHTDIPRIAGRCSVFAKTDIIHLQQEGTSIDNILMGLSYAVARTFKGAVIKKQRLELPILFLGGVASNPAMVHAIEKLLDVEGQLVVPEEHNVSGAIGAAMQALQQANELKWDDIVLIINSYSDNKMVSTASLAKLEMDSDRRFNPLTAKSSKGIYDGPKNTTIDTSEITGVYIGVDVGSTSTNVVMLSQNGDVLDYRYLATAGKPLQVVQQGLQEIGVNVKGIKVLGVGVTGSGRYLTGEYVGADLVKDEITAQARAAAEYNANVDTVLEIGGQDSKFIRLNQGTIVDFEMNKVCAAGTGSFLEEQCKKLNIQVEDMGEMALAAEEPSNLGERCTVFMETSLTSYLLQGAKLNDLVAGLCYGVAANYLNRVVAGRPLGDNIVFQGGVANNLGVLAAFEKLTGKKITQAPHASITGCIGAALLAKDANIIESQFKGFDKFAGSIDVESIKLNVKAVGNLSNADVSTGKNPSSEPELFALRNQRYLAHYTGEKIPGKKTIGIPRVLFVHKMFPMFRTLFTHLGYNVVLSDATDESIVKASQEYSFEEACFPVKLINGHVANLLGQGVDYVFLPNVVTMKHPVSKTRQDYPCTFMQQAALTVKLAMDLEGKGVELLNPTLSFKFGKLYMMKTFVKLGLKLGSLPHNTIKGVKKAFGAFEAFDKGLETMGKEYLSKVSTNELVFVLMTRPYGVIDPVLNMKIPQKLHQMGHKVIPMDVLPVHGYDMNVDYPNMYWPFGQHILAAAKIIKDTPNLYAIYLTNHGCGPDTMISHFMQQEMGDKPYLHLEVDEHYSSVGVQTRLEAFINSLEKQISSRVDVTDTAPNQVAATTEAHVEAVNTATQSILTKQGLHQVLVLPNWGSYSKVAAKYLINRGHKVEILPQTTTVSMAIGRKFSISKEYFTMVSLLGDVFSYLAKPTQENTQVSLLIPTSEGAEIHGLYGQLVQRELLNANYTDVKVVSPFIEDLFQDGAWLSYGEDLFKRMLAVDWLNYVLSQCGGIYGANKQTLTEYDHAIDTIEEWFEDGSQCKAIAAKLLQGHNPNLIPIGMIGEAWAIYNPALRKEFELEINRLGGTLINPPLSELVLTNIMQKRDEHAAQKEGKKYLQYMMLYMKTHGLYQDFAKKVEDSGTIFADPKEIMLEGTKYLKHFFAGLAQHRLGKPKIMRQQGIKGVIHFTSMYENVGIIVNLLSGKAREEANVPWLNFGYDGRLTQKDELNLEAFVESLKEEK